MVFISQVCLKLITCLCFYSWRIRVNLRQFQVIKGSKRAPAAWECQAHCTQAEGRTHGAEGRKDCVCAEPCAAFVYWSLCSFWARKAAAASHRGHIWEHLYLNTKMHTESITSKLSGRRRQWLSLSTWWKWVVFLPKHSSELQALALGPATPSPWQASWGLS